MVHIQLEKNICITLPLKGSQTIKPGFRLCYYALYSKC